jgi:hypothetical protein
MQECKLQHTKGCASCFNAEGASTMLTVSTGLALLDNKPVQLEVNAACMLLLLLLLCCTTQCRQWQSTPTATRPASR